MVAFLDNLFGSKDKASTRPNLDEAMGSHRRREPVSLSQWEELWVKTKAGIAGGAKWAGLAGAGSLILFPALTMMYPTQVAAGTGLHALIFGTNATATSATALALAPTVLAGAAGFAMNAFSSVPVREALALKKREQAEKIAYENAVVSKATGRQQKLEEWMDANDVQANALLNGGHGLPLDGYAPPTRGV